MEKLAQYRATHGNPQGSDYEFVPDIEANSLFRTIWNVIRGLSTQRSLDAVIALRVDPKNPRTREKLEEAVDTNNWILGQGRFDTRMTVADKVPNRKGKKRRR